MSALTAAAAEFLGDEHRRRTRHQRPRLTAHEHARLQDEIRAFTVDRHGPDDTRAKAVARGEAAVQLFEYPDTFDAAAETVIVDILHAVAAYGWSPQAVLDNVILYYAEERA